MYGEKLQKFFGYECIGLLLAEAALALSISFSTAEDMATFWSDSLKLFAMFYLLERTVIYAVDAIVDSIQAIKDDNAKLQRYFASITDDLKTDF